MKITIETIPHSQQRYDTCGDWLFDDNGDLLIRVSELGDWRYEALVGVHELIEVLICKHRGISQEEVDKFDINYLAAGRPHEGEPDEPGDAKDCPCRAEHFAATTIERMLSSELSVDWWDYGTAVEEL